MNKTNRLYWVLLVMIAWVGFGIGCRGAAHQLNPTPTFLPTPTVGEIISGLNSSDPLIRADAAGGALAYFDHSDADKILLLPHLVGTLSDSDGRVRVFAIQSLGGLEIYNEKAVQILISRLNNEHYRYVEFEQLVTMQALHQFSDYAHEAIPGLIRVLLEPGTHSKMAAAETLSVIGDPVAVPYLLSIVLSASNESWVREAVALALAEFGSDARCTVPYLVPLLDSPEKNISSGAATAINRAINDEFENRTANATRTWWQEKGQYEEWPECLGGLNGEMILPPAHTPSIVPP